MSRAAYAQTRCFFCGRVISVAGLAQYNHLAGHFRRTFKREPPHSTLKIRQSLRTATFVR